MAPVFGTIETLLSRLRLSGLCTTKSGAIDIVNESVLRARIEMRCAFGATKMSQYMILPDPEDDPTTDDHYLFYTLRQLEDTLVESYLCRRLTQTSLDGSAGNIEWFNQESPYRLMEPGQVDDYCKRIMQRATDLFEILGVQDSYELPGSPSAITLGPSDSPPLVQGLGSDIAPLPQEAAPRYPLGLL